MGNPYSVAPITTKAIWKWNTNNPNDPVPTTFYNNNITKTGLLPQDLQAFVGVPLQNYSNPPVPVSNSTLLQWIRYAEDYVEQETNLLLCPTMVASPPSLNPLQNVPAGIVPVNGDYQQLGIDYDLADTAYDFFFELMQDSAWGVRPLRYRPLRNMSPSTDTTATKLITFIYPLLSDFMRIPPSWIVEDQDFGMLRLVPSQDVALLPLYAIELAFMGFSSNLPGGIWTFYTAGLTNYDYATRFSFVKELVLAIAAIQALASIQGTLNLGADAIETSVDGLAQKIVYGKGGPYANLMMRFDNMKKELTRTVHSKISGPNFLYL